MDLNSSFRGTAQLSVGRRLRLEQRSYPSRTRLLNPLSDARRLEHAESKVAFEIDEISPATREGWSILVQGGAHPVESETERASVMQSGVEPWAGGEKELFVRVIPTRITARRIRRTAPPATG
jgi:hypothetical protein